MTPTFTQALLLGADRLSSAPPPPHAALETVWDRLDWAGAKDAALLEASALAGSARIAGAVATGPIPAVDAAPAESRPAAPTRAIEVLRRLLIDEGRMLLPEWIEACDRSGARVPPLFLPALFATVTAPEERAVLLRVIGNRGPWLARQNPAWAWVIAAAPQPDPGRWETGTAEERLACLRDLRRGDPAQASALAARTWSDDPPEFRLQVLAELKPTFSLADEPLLTRALGDRRKEVRLAAQAGLAALPESAFARRQLDRAEPLLGLSRGLLGRKLEVVLPAAFDAAWKADAIEEKPPAGLGEKAHWAQQVLGLVPASRWIRKFGIAPAELVALAAKSSDWGDLLLGAWFRAACVHRDSALAAALLKPLLAHPKALPPGTQPEGAITALLAACDDATRWQLAAAEPEVAWLALPWLAGSAPEPAGRALFAHLWPALREGYNPGGAASAVLAARRAPAGLRDEAVRRLARDEGLSKPAEAFLQALDLRAELHAAFSRTPSLPPRTP
jgi:hypothetical protein